MCHVVELAKAEAEENPNASAALKEFGAIRTKDAEQKAHQVLRKHDLTCPVDIDRVDLADTKRHKGFPYFKFLKWVEYLLNTGRLARQLCACDSLESMRVKLKTFWDRYETILPTHKIFEMKEKGEIDLGLVIPVYSHTDEGRSYKKQPLWLLSTHGALGRGSKGYLKKKKDKISLKRCGLGLNFCGHTWSTNFMFGCMLRKFFKKNPEVLDNFVRVYAQDMEELFVNGVWDQTGTVNIRVCHLGNKGDLPALTRMGNMNYSFNNAPKAAQSRKPCEGVCWMCLAGQEANPATGAVAIPYEDTSGKPLWENTLGEQRAWEETPPILEGVPLREQDHYLFFKTDVWHNFHLGVCKHWVASSLVSMVECLDLPYGSMDEKINWLAEEYRSFCRRKKLSPHCDELGRDTLGWYQSSTCPIGTWNKGSQSTHYMMFLDDFCSRHWCKIQGEPLLEAIVSSIVWQVCFLLFFFGFFGVILLYLRGISQFIDVCFFPATPKPDEGNGNEIHEHGHFCDVL